MTKDALVVALDQTLSLADSRAVFGLRLGGAPQAETLPLNQGVVAVVQAEAAAGRAVFLLAEDAALASKLASRLGIFAGIIVPDHGIGETRLQAVLRVTKGRPFGFIGHDAADMPIWHAAHQAWVVGGGRHLRQKVNGVPLAGGSSTLYLGARTWASHA